MTSPTVSSLSLAAASPPDGIDKKASEKARRAAVARRNSGRRRFVDPATCERDYSGQEMEFLRAIEAYKLSSGRLFPTWSEVLEVVRSLGYEQAAGVAR